MSAKPNILFLSIEDLNDWIEPLGGHPDAKTPNLSRLAKRGMVFQSAYAPAPACSPSRTATLFGQYPWETGVYANSHKFFEYYSQGTRKSLVGRFRDAGYETRGAGKVFHAKDAEIDPADWTYFKCRKKERFAKTSQAVKDDAIGRGSDFGPSAIDEQFDDYNTSWIIDQMQSGATGQFWALGLYRPHLPFIVPQKYFDMFSGDIANPPGLGMNQFDPNNKTTQRQLPRPGRAFAGLCVNLSQALGHPKQYQDFLRAYLASVAYADALLGRVLDHLDATNLWDNTTVVLWSDHGWQFGEKLAFRKFTLWERALRVPIIFAGPGIKTGRSAEPVSLVDIAPTLFARAGLPIPTQFSGQDLSPALEQKATGLRGNAVSVWGFRFTSEGPKMALTTRSKTHRYIFYWDGSEELYDHRVDPYEHNNLIHADGGIPISEVNMLRESLQPALDFELADPISVSAAS